MPEIGETLRETRMRRRIDMTEVEAATKIRAKYLRALENEEWDLLPGPTFVKTFLRTYAEYLELDPRLLVEEYRQRYERPSTQDLRPFKPGAAAQRRRRRRGPSLGPILVVLLGLVGLLAALYALGQWGDNGPTPPPSAATATPTPSATPTATARPRRTRKAPVPKVVSLRLTARQLVYVCVVDARGRKLVNGVNLQPGKSTATLRSARLRMNLGNANVRLRANGKTYAVADTGSPVGYELRPGKPPRRLSDSVRAGLCR
jgi:transcriptional regulator with XRE-family HTH domain